MFSKELKVFEINNYTSAIKCQVENAYFDLNKTDVPRAQGSHEVMIQSDNIKMDKAGEFQY